MGTFDSIYQQKIRKLEEENRQLRKILEAAPPQMVPEPMEDGEPQRWILPPSKALDVLRMLRGRNPRPAAPTKPRLNPGDILPGNPLRPGDTLPSYDPPNPRPLNPGDTL